MSSKWLLICVIINYSTVNDKQYNCFTNKVSHVTFDVVSDLFLTHFFFIWMLFLMPSTYKYYTLLLLLHLHDTLIIAVNDFLVDAWGTDGLAVNHFMVLNCDHNDICHTNRPGVLALYSLIFFLLFFLFFENHFCKQVKGLPFCCLKSN